MNQCRPGPAQMVQIITGLAHPVLPVPDVEEAVRWYESALGMTVLSPPLPVEYDAMPTDRGALLADPVRRAAILGFGIDDRVLEVVEHPA